MIHTSQVKRFTYKRSTKGQAISALNSYTQQPHYLFGYIEEKKNEFSITVLMKAYGKTVKRQHRAIVFTREVEI